MPRVPAATNYILNPNMEGTFAADQYQELGATGTVETGIVYQSTKSLKASAAGGAADQGLRLKTAAGIGGTSTRTFYGSLYAYGAGTLYLQLTVFYNGGGFTSGAVTNFTASTTWTRIKANVTTVGATAVDYLVLDLRTQTNQVTAFYEDAAQVSLIDTSYFDGSMPHCAWTGVANNSTSTRTAYGATTVPGLMLPV